MSWDANLWTVTQVTACPDCGHALEPPREQRSEAGWWNYTHNTSRMIYPVLADAGIEVPDTWWKHLDGMSGADGAEFLSVIIAGLEADPERYRAMNPENGWGDYDSLLGVLRAMRDAVPAGEVTVWEASG